MNIEIIQTLEDLEELRLCWEKWQWHPNNDFAQFKMICHIRPEVECPCVAVVQRDGQPQALLAGRLEQVQFAPSIGYFNPVKVPARVMAVLHQGVLGRMNDEAAASVVEHLWSLLRSGMADVIEFHYCSEDSALVKALRLHMSGWFCEKNPRQSVHWEMTISEQEEFLKYKVGSKQRWKIRKRQKEIELAFPGRVSWRWMKSFDDIPGLCSRLEDVAACAYQRGLGTGFMDTEEYRSRFTLFASRGQLRLQLMEIDGKVRAFWFGYLYDGIFHLSETAYDPILSQYELGTLIFVRLCDELSKEGVRKLDFGIGDAVYKQRFGDRSWREGTVRLFAPTAKGAILRACSGLFTVIDKIGRTVIQKLGFLDRLKTGWRRQLTPAQLSADEKS